MIHNEFVIDRAGRNSQTTQFLTTELFASTVKSAIIGHARSRALDYLNVDMDAVADA